MLTISSSCPTSDTHHAYILKIYLATMPAYDVIKGKSLKRFESNIGYYNITEENLM
jgi:hypothetical protein